MARRWVIGALAAAGVLGIAAAAMAADVRAGEDVNVTGAFADMLFAAGDQVKLTVNATDDAFAAGDDVTAQGSTFDHAYLTGGDVTFQDSTAHDLFAAGGDVQLLSGQIVDDFVAAGGDIKLAREARIGGDAVIAGGDLQVRTPIGGQARLAGGTIELNSDVAGDVYLDGGDITIGPDAHIHGSLTHRGRSVTISPQAQIDGQTTVLEPRSEPNFAPLRHFLGVASITILFGTLLLAVVVALAFPRLMNGSSELVQNHPLRMLLFGFVIAIFAPVLIILLMVTVLGLPLGLLLGALFCVLWPLGIVASVYAAAMFVRERAHAGEGAPKAGERALWAGGGMALLIALGFVPVFGFLMWFLAYLLGVGAVAVHTIGVTRTPAIAT